MGVEDGAVGRQFSVVLISSFQPRDSPYLLTDVFGMGARFTAVFRQPIGVFGRGSSVEIKSETRRSSEIFDPPDGAFSEYGSTNCGSRTKWRAELPGL